MLDLKKDIIEYLRSKEDPTKLKSILHALGLPKSDKQYIRSLLSELTRAGDVVKSGTHFWVPDGKQRSLQIKRTKTRTRNEVSGRLMVTSGGFGFVAGKKGHDIRIEERDLKGAMHGDLVRVEILGKGRQGKLTGQVVAIESFGRNQILGVFAVNRRGDVDFHAFTKFHIDKSKMQGFPREVSEGQVGSWKRLESGIWQFEAMIGHVSDPNIDETIVLMENGIETSFPSDCQDQANAFDQDMAFELGERHDFRDKLVFTVDGATARDFDDALHFVHHGSYIEVGVHIADVSHFVTPGSPLDQWAATQGNSTYLPHKAIPMLPERLSTNLCSLNPDVPRYTLSAVIHMTPEGEVKSYRFFKGLIQSRHRLTYAQVQAAAVEKDEALRATFPEDLLQALDLSIELSRNMHARRHAAGGLAIDMLDSRIVLDQAQTISSVELFRQTDANRMIEAFMCVTNECVARFFDDHGISIPYRIHDQPDPEKLEQLGSFLASFDIEVPEFLLEEPGKALNHLIKAVKDLPNAQVLQTQILKSMKMAEYSTDNHGHFGLASSDYAHFTSPIRRYADLVIHQRMTKLLTEKKVLPEDFVDTNLNDICAHISTKERDSAKAEQTFVQLKMLRHLEDEVGSEFGGVIAEIKPFGLFILLHKFQVSGLVHIEELSDDYYEFVPERLSLIGESKGKEYKVGLEVAVVLTRVDFIQRKIDLTLAHDWAARKRGNARSKGGGRRGLSVRRPEGSGGRKGPNNKRNDPRSRFKSIARNSGKSKGPKGGKGRKR